ncbi:hypothetical protein [Deinococcus depolymerans]|uniref:Uncharacterized protein n=1 Tax=Deinococcus depolymerans TaxID=392408 RepID=A0ABP3LWY8_9DEIO
MTDAELLARAHEMMNALRAGEQIWINDVLHMWEQLYSKARDTEREQALVWAEAAFALVSACPDCWREPLSIRLLMIARFGSQDGHPLLDAQVLTADALKLIPWTPEELKVLFPDWRRQDSATIRQLGRVRNVLAFLAQLAEFLPRPLHPELQDWLEVRAVARTP